MTESARLRLLENRYRKNERIVNKAWYESHLILLAIRDEKLYRYAKTKYTSFEAYLNDRLGISKQHGMRLVGAAEFIKIAKQNVTGNGKTGDLLPANEWQLRPLIDKLPHNGARLKVWSDVVSSGEKPTQRLVQEKVDEFLASGEVIEDVEYEVIDYKLPEEVKKLAKEKKRQEAVARAAKVLMHIPDDFNVKHGNFVEVAASIPDDSVDFIFTDPPYHDKTLNVYDELGVIAARVLKPGASLVTYISHHRMPEILNTIITGGMTFFWPLAMVHSGRHARMTEYGIEVCWKPLLWFVKGKFRDRENMDFLKDLVTSEQQKGSHDWQQSTVEAEYYIEKLCPPGGLVFDPFCGGGTTAVAAKKLKRLWLTCDTDEGSAIVARERISNV